MNAPAVCAIYYVEIMIMYCRHPDGSGFSQRKKIQKVLTLASQPKREVCNPHLESAPPLTASASAAPLFYIIGDGLSSRKPV